MDDQQHVVDLVDAYALGALEPDEVAYVETHLAHCPACEAAAHAARMTAERLLLGAPLVAPSTGLRGRVLARVHAEAQADLREETQQRSQRSENNHNAADTPTRSRLSNLIARFRGVATDTGADEVNDALGVLLSLPDCTLVEVNGTADAPGARARLVGSPSRHEAVLITSGLQSLPPDRAYQIWLLRDGQPYPNALFRSARNGHGQQVAHMREPLGLYNAVAVTPEPATGSPGPTGPIVLLGELPTNE